MGWRPLPGRRWSGEAATPPDKDLALWSCLVLRPGNQRPTIVAGGEVEERWARVWLSGYEEARITGEVEVWTPSVHDLHLKKDDDCSTGMAAK